MHGSRRKRLNYLTMWLDYAIPGEVRISMKKYLRGVLEDFPEEIIEAPETKDASNLFNVRDENKQEIIDKTQAQAFHHALAQLLFTGIQCRKDAHTEIAFLTTRVRNPNEDDWDKLRRLLWYLKRKIKLPLILRADG